MERRFYNEDFDFEQLIKQKADQHKLYPSAKVWKGIYRSLHPTSRWYWFSLVLFLSGIAYYALEKLNVTTAEPNSVAKNVEQAIPESGNSTESIVLPFGIKPQIEVNDKPGSGTRGALVLNMRDFQSLTTRPDVTSSMDPLSKENIPAIVRDNSANDAQNEWSPAASIQSKDLDINSTLISSKDAIQPEKFMNQSVNTTIAPVATSSGADYAEEGDEKRINWLQQYAVIELVAPKVKRWSWQVSLTPTMNYRKLYGNEDAKLGSDVKNIPIALNIEGDIDNLVNHKPAIGFEAGSAMLYAVDKNLTFKAGMLFNYSRYDIEAFSSYSAEMATIALNGYYGASDDSLTSYTSIRNFGGYAAKEIRNEYFQLSLPIGAEFVLIGSRRLQFAVAGTIQPTYVLNRDNYLITTDYKNYTKEPSLVRRWNMNTSAEAFVSYKAAGLKFQVGPQFRYQVFSSYNNEYPVKEYLMEYGVKFGVSKTFR